MTSLSLLAGRTVINGKQNIKHVFDRLWGESLIIDPGIMGLITAQPHIFLEIA